MARARNIKPAFFDNDKLAENDPLGRLLFIGLWTIADHNGNLEWRAKRIKVKLLPYDDCDIQKLAINLDKSGFVRFYSDGNQIYLNIPNFLTHQNPHKNEREKGTEIPCYSEPMRQAVDLKGLTINRDKSGLDQESSTSDPADSLIPYPDSLILIPDSSTPDKPGVDGGKPPSKTKNPSLDYSCWPSLPTDQVLKDWVAHRKRVKAPVSQTVINRLAGKLRQCEEEGYSVDDCLSESVTRGWKGIELEWLTNAGVKPSIPPAQAKAKSSPMAEIKAEYQELHSRVKADEQLGIETSAEIQARLQELVEKMRAG